MLERVKDTPVGNSKEEEEEDKRNQRAKGDSHTGHCGQLCSSLTHNTTVRLVLFSTGCSL